MKNLLKARLAGLASRFGLSKKDLWLALLTLAVLAVMFTIFELTPVKTARFLDIRFGYYAILTAFLLFVLAAVWNAQEFWKRLRAHLPSGPVAAAGVLVLCFFAVFIASNIGVSHRVLSDETSWESMALQMHFESSGGICNEGVWKAGVLECATEVNNFKGKALGLLESFAYALLGPGRDTALKVNFPLYMASLVAFFFALFAWFKNDKLALAGMVFLGGIPIFMMQARSASTEVLYVFLLSLLMLWYALVPAKEVKFRHFALTVPLLGLFAQTRQETVFAFIPFAVYYVGYFRERVYRLPLFVLAVILLSWPSINTMAAYRGFDFQGGEHAAHSLSNFAYNFKTDLWLMLNFEGDSSFGGIMQNPFYSTFTVLLLLAALWLLVRIVFAKRYRFGALLALLFSLQIFVVLLNVSGTFEIDINQRYVLIALPLFALITALGIFDALSLTKLGRERAGFVTAALAIVLTLVLSLYHVESFRANMLYYKNKLLGEEDFLNSKLNAFPENSVFIYSRPWQMLASLHSGFSERSFLNWTDSELSEWLMNSGGNLYLVQGQDGRGSVNKKSRVVGFKTTTQIEKILENYKTEVVLQEKRLFGYPLIVYKIHGKRGVSKYRQGVSVSEFDPGASKFTVRRSFAEAIPTSFSVNGVPRLEPLLSLETEAVELDSAWLLDGMNRARLECYLPDGDTLVFERDIFREAGNVALLSGWKIASYSQAWGDPQKNESVEHNRLRIGKAEFRYGIGSHATSNLKFEIPREFDGRELTLLGTVGLDDESVCGDGVTFVVRTDGGEVFRSQRLYSEDTQRLEVKLGRPRELRLIAEEGKNKDCDHADWANVWIRAE